MMRGETDYPCPISDRVLDDVKVGRDGNVLLIIVKERPTIDSIEFEGNKAIKTEMLTEGLSDAGLAEGEILKK